MLAAVSRSPGNAVIDDIPEPCPSRAARAVARPEAAGIRGSVCTIIPAIPAHCRVPGIIAREFRATSSPPPAGPGPVAPSALVPGMPGSRAARRCPRPRGQRRRQGSRDTIRETEGAET